jgi:hypothetical protein
VGPASKIQPLGEKHESAQLNLVCPCVPPLSVAGRQQKKKNKLAEEKKKDGHQK